MANAKRKALPKKLRFEVFKRDSFTCQYCGRMAPDVVLEVDHIVPVAEGGTNDIMNLITSCHDCNSGKGKRKLSENEEVKKQQDMLKELNEKREQIEMMLEWRNELLNFEKDQIDKIENMFCSFCGGGSFTESGRKTISNLIKKYGFIEVYDCTRIALENYYDFNDPKTSFKAFEYISRICYNRKTQSEVPILKSVNYLVKMAKNRFRYVNDHLMRAFLCDFMSEDDFEKLKVCIKLSRNWTDLKNRLYEYFGVSEGLDWQ